MELDKQGREGKAILFATIFMLSNKLQTFGDAYFKEVSTKQWFVLLVLNVMNGYSPTLNELSEVVGSSHQNVKQLVAKLEQKGYVKLAADQADKRRLRISVTPKCEEFVRSYEDKNAEFMNRLFTGLKHEDLDITIRVLEAMKISLERLEKGYVGE